jgi:hypothetical protein
MTDLPLRSLLSGFRGTFTDAPSKFFLRIKSEMKRNSTLLKRQYLFRKTLLALLLKTISILISL